MTDSKNSNLFIPLQIKQLKAHLKILVEKKKKKKKEYKIVEK